MFKHKNTSRFTFGEQIVLGIRARDIANNHMFQTPLTQALSPLRIHDTETMHYEGYYGNKETNRKRIHSGQTSEICKS